MQELKKEEGLASWNTGSGRSIIFSDILSFLLKNPSYNIHIGTDSQIKSNNVHYVIAICVTNPSGGGRYFFRKIYEKKYKNISLGIRLQKEVGMSIEIAEQVSQCIDISKISIHVDINDSPKYASSKFASGLTNYVKSMGYTCFIKPYSWASFSVADRHTK